MIMATDYWTKIEVDIEPVWHDELPEIEISFAKQRLFLGALSERRTFEIQQRLPSGSYDLVIDFINKKDSDTDLSKGLDKAVIIRRVAINGLSDAKFIWAGIYRPRYPQMWLSQQTQPPAAELLAKDYLGWNGTWTLHLTCPVFSWIHRTLGLGWIYA